MKNVVRLPPLNEARPRCSGDINGNVLNVVAHAKRALVKAGKTAYANELMLRVANHEFKTYHEALAAVQEYVIFEFGSTDEVTPMPPRRPPGFIDIDGLDNDDEDLDDDDDDDDDESFYDEVKNDDDDPDNDEEAEDDDEDSWT